MTVGQVAGEEAVTEAVRSEQLDLTREDLPGR